MSAEDRDPDRAARKLRWLVMDTEEKLNAGGRDLQHLLEDLLGRITAEAKRLDPAGADPDRRDPEPAYPLVMSIADIDAL